MLTSNDGFDECDGVFGDNAMAAALCDRLAYHCHLVTIRTNSSDATAERRLWQALQVSQQT